MQMIPNYISPDGNFTKYGLLFDCGYSGAASSEFHPVAIIAELLVYSIIIILFYYGVKKLRK